MLAAIGAIGTYSVSGTTITTIATTPAGGSISSSTPYCVQSNALYLFGHDSPTAIWATGRDASAPGQDPVYEVVAPKQ